MFSRSEKGACGIEEESNWFFKIHFLWISSFIWIVSFVTCLTVSIAFPDNGDPPLGTTYQTRFHNFEQFDQNSIFTIDEIDNPDQGDFGFIEKEENEENRLGWFDRIFKCYLKFSKPLPAKDEHEFLMSQTKQQKLIVNCLSLGIATAHIAIIIYFSV